MSDSSQPMSGLNFSLLTSNTTRFGPRLGNVVFKRSENAQIEVQTPGLLISTSRGVIPHLAQDHHTTTDAVQWVNIPFETFLENTPPVPTIQPGRTPLHTFLGFPPHKNILSISARDPYDGREMPTNSNSYLCAYGLRGVRKLTPVAWKSYVLACKPDIVTALSDTPFTNPPYSQKRLTKSIDRSTSWLLDILKPSPDVDLPNVFVHMSGGTSVQARQAFSENLLEPLAGPELEAIKPLQRLDDGVSGYTFDLVPLRLTLEATRKKAESAEQPTESSSSVSEKVDLNPKISPHSEEIIPLLQASLSRLPTSKIRLVNSTQSPHEILNLISTTGIDLFDAHWAQRAADIGVALDFAFPAPSSAAKRDLGHNLYDVAYAHDFSSLARDLQCRCKACSPLAPKTRIYHGVDGVEYSGELLNSHTQPKSSFTRAYLHHLLHTHEMSAHALLVMHNITILDAFFSGVRRILREEPDRWMDEAAQFVQTYDGDLLVLDQAKVSWKEVELARGKGRLAREKIKQEEATLGTAIELEDI